jgi:hypothetical protein
MIVTNVKRSPWTRRSRVSALVAWTSLAAVVFVGGCENQVNSYCVSRCNCQGCSQLEQADCLDDVGDSERLAAHDGCANEFAAYVQCYANEGSCANGGWIASTCSGAASALQTCSNRSATFVTTACREEEAKRKTCGLTGGGADPCAGAEECTAFCALAASCDELLNTPEDSTYIQCVIACTSSSSSSGGP